MSEETPKEAGHGRLENTSRSDDLIKDKEKGRRYLLGLTKSQGKPIEKEVTKALEEKEREYLSTSTDEDFCQWAGLARINQATIVLTLMMIINNS